MPTPETKGPDGKRRLPLLPKVEVGDEGDEDRPPWHWSAIGVAAIFLLWLPLAALINAALARLAPAADPATVPRSTQALLVGGNLLGFALACLGGGLLVGRFGAKAGPREAMVSGAAAATLAWILGVTGAHAGPAIAALLLLLLAAVGAGAARLGGALGVRARKP
ncbi:MAG: hypothetical protein U0359_41245 [Byssovorax sp.]